MNPVLRSICLFAIGITMLAGAESRAASNLGFRGGYGLRGDKDFFARRHRLVGTIDADIQLESSSPLVLALIGEWENSLWWFDLSDDDFVDSWTGFESLVDVIPAIGVEVGTQSKMRALLGLGGTAKAGVSAIDISSADGWSDEDLDVSEAQVGLVVQPMIRLQTAQVTLSGLIKYRYLTGREHLDYASLGGVSGGHAIDDEDFDLRTQTLTLRGQAGLVIDPIRLVAGLQLENQKGISKRDGQRGWPDWGDWPDDWEVLLFGGLYIEL